MSNLLGWQNPNSNINLAPLLTKSIIEMWVHWMMHKLDHTPYIEKQIVELVVAALAINIVSRVNCVYVGPQNGSILHEPTL